MNTGHMPMRGDVILVRGGGDLATGVIQKLAHAGFRVAVMEIAAPTAIRRTVALCSAVFEGTAQVEDIQAELVTHTDAFAGAWARGVVPVIVDPDMKTVSQLKPDGLIEATLAKRNTGRVSASLAPIVIAMGPGFSAPEDAHAIIETQRGHQLGRVIFAGSALPDTGTPGVIGGQGSLRVLRTPSPGTVLPLHAIGDAVTEGEPVFSVDCQTVRAPFSGLLRGMMREGLSVAPGDKVADIDPRLDSDWHTISDKARSVGGGVLDAYLYLKSRA